MSIKKLLLFCFFLTFYSRQIECYDCVSFNPVSGIAGKTLLFDNEIKENPALFTESELDFATIIYSPSNFNLPELSPALIMAGNRLSDNFRLGLSLYNLGNSKYSEFSFGLHSGLSISDILSGGVSINYGRKSIQNYSSFSSFDISLGMILKISEILNAGFNYSYLNNPYSDRVEPLFNHIAKIGFGASLNEELSLEIASRILVNYQTGFIMTGRYLYENLLAIQIGFSTEPSIAGLSIKIIPVEYLGISAGLNYHSALGFSKTLALSFYW